MAKESDGESEQDAASAYPRTFANRGPNKRKIKPTVESQLIQFHMFSDSEDDEDFVAHSGDDDDYSDRSSDDSGGEMNKGNEQISQAENDDDSGLLAKAGREQELAVTAENDAENEESTEMEDDSGDDGASTSMNNLSKEEETAELLKEVSRETAKSVNKMVCGICLESESTEEDELVECDWCGISVHEGCYGDANDVESDDKSDSDADTEPWFCDACKAKCESCCELCPVKGGILKQTDAGQWVHLVCALYVPGVGFRDVDRLRTIVLEDIATNKWNSRRCVLCEDQRFSKTGICIQCDAGLCKTFFHVTCAQKRGLLTEVPAAGNLNDDDADPLYAHCQLHTDKTVMKTRMKHWITFESNMRNFKPSDDSDEKARTENAFKRAREEYFEFRRGLSPATLQTADKPRLLTSCPELCKQLLRKAELMGYSTTSEEISVSNSGYNPAFKPSLSCDFVNHFFKRDTLASKYQNNELPFRQTIENKKEEQKELQNLLGDLKVQLEKYKARKSDLFSNVSKLHDALERMNGKKLPLPNVLKPKKKQRKLSETVIESVIKACATCDGTHDQHLLALCDTCHNYHHIGCLDPPLSALPKKGAKWLWQCTECDQSESSDESIDDEGPASKRRRRKSNAPQKFTPTEETKKTKKRTSNHQGRIGRPKKNNEVQIQDPDKRLTTEKEAKGNWRGRKRKAPDKLEPCHVCCKDGEPKTMVKCDECLHSYHFDCCEPKLKSNPKKRGYMWMCNDCNETSDDDDDESNGENAEESSPKHEKAKLGENGTMET